uniref:Uncharacterized protein n=1 Tax=Cucumis melo TaxID=3656 RepID=A0A9I9EBA3_CUCME
MWPSNLSLLRTIHHIKTLFKHIQQVLYISWICGPSNTVAPNFFNRSIPYAFSGSICSTLSGLPISSTVLANCSFLAPPQTLRVLDSPIDGPWVGPCILS